MHPRPHLLPCLAALTACGSVGPADTTGATDTSPDLAPAPSITSVTPDYGTNGGGEFVTITGGPFPDDPVVEIGGGLATVVAATRDQIQLTTGPSDRDGWVPIAVSGAEGEVVKQKRAYQLWPDGTGLTGLWGEVYRMDYLGTYWSGGTGYGPYKPPPIGQVRMVFLRPSALRYRDVWAPALDTCALDHAPSLTATVFDTEMEAMTLTGSAGESIRLEPSALDFGYFDALQVEPLLLGPGTVYDLEPGGANGTWPAFGVDGIATMPDRPEILSPLLDADYPPVVYGDLDLQWQPSGNGSYLVARVSRTSGYGAVIEETASCLLADDGQHVLPATTWTTWLPGEYLIVQLGRVHEADRTLPHDRSTSQLVGVYWVYGALQAL